MDKEIAINFSLFAPKISEQLTNQGFKFSEDEAKSFEDAAESIQTLDLMDILNYSEKEKAIKKLFTKIKAHVKRKNKMREAKL